MTRKERLTKKRSALEMRKLQSMRAGRMLDVMRLDRDISELNREIAECERYEMLPLSSLFDEDTAVDSGLIAALRKKSLSYITNRMSHAKS